MRKNSKQTESFRAQQPWKVCNFEVCKCIVRRDLLLKMFWSVIRSQLVGWYSGGGMKGKVGWSNKLACRTCGRRDDEIRTFLGDNEAC